MSEQKTAPTDIGAVNQKIEAINQQIVTLKEQLNKTHEDIKKHMENRDQLNNKAKALRAEIAEIKKERDQLNQSVKTLKAQRDEVRGQMAPFIEQIKEHSEKIRELREKRQGQSRQELQKAFDALEFKIATTSMDLKEEKRHIDQVKEIEVQLSTFKKMDAHSKKISEIKAEEISSGNMNVTVSVKRKDEIGDLAESFSRMVASLKFMMSEDQPATEEEKQA